MAEGEEEMCHTYLALLLLAPSAAIVSAAEEEAMGRHNPTPGIEMCDAYLFALRRWEGTKGPLKQDVLLRKLSKIRSF